MLAANHGHRVSVDALIHGVWGDAPPRTAIKTLHSHIARVRAALDACGLPDALVTREPGYLLAVPPGAIDVHRFERAAREARDLLASGAGDEQIFTDFYLAALSREPDADELKQLKTILAKREDREAGLREFVWALISSREFAENH